MMHDARKCGGSTKQTVNATIGTFSDPRSVGGTKLCAVTGANLLRASGGEDPPGGGQLGSGSSQRRSA